MEIWADGEIFPRINSTELVVGWVYVFSFSVFPHRCWDKYLVQEMIMVHL